MAVSAYVHINVRSGHTRETLRRVSRIQGVKSVDSVMGPFDIIAFVRGNDVEAVAKTVTTKIQALPGVRKTMTSVIV